MFLLCFKVLLLEVEDLLRSLDCDMYMDFNFVSWKFDGLE